MENLTETLDPGCRSESDLAENPGGLPAGAGHFWQPDGQGIRPSFDLPSSIRVQCIQGSSELIVSSRRAPEFRLRHSSPGRCLEACGAINVFKQVAYSVFFLIASAASPAFSLPSSTVWSAFFPAFSIGPSFWHAVNPKIRAAARHDKTIRLKSDISVSPYNWVGCRCLEGSAKRIENKNGAAFVNSPKRKSSHSPFWTSCRAFRRAASWASISLQAV